MFRRKVLTLGDVINKLLREEGLETPLKQKRLIDSWEQIMGDMVAKYTTQKFIKNQTLYVKIENPALRQDLSMMRSQLVKKLNDHVGSFVISDVHIY
jgi:predicted nucleic acid-binding Zn ribbon protein